MLRERVVMIVELAVAAEGTSLSSLNIYVDEKERRLTWQESFFGDTA
jgi:hypothetical protein